MNVLNNRIKANERPSGLPIFHSLVYVSANKRVSAVNQKFSDHSAQVRSYVAQAVVLSESLVANGYDLLHLVTNAVEEIQDELLRIGATTKLKVISLVETMTVPDGIRFYEAHFKIDVIRMFASDYAAVGGGGYYLLLDTDVLCHHASPELDDAVRNGTALVYDISAQVMPAYSQELVASDVRKIAGIERKGIRWFGGEFIGGRPGFFKELVDAIDVLAPHYFAQYSTLHHIGDEMLVTAALNGRLANHDLLDAGAAQVVARHWTVPNRHPQAAFRWAVACAFGHYPADKDILANVGLRKGHAAARCAIGWRATWRPPVRAALMPVVRAIRKARAGGGAK